MRLVFVGQPTNLALQWSTGAQAPEGLRRVGCEPAATDRGVGEQAGAWNDVLA